MSEIQLTPAARSHLLDIWDYTASMWGDDQADTSIREIHAAFLRLAETPFLGMARPDIHVGYRSLPVQQHIVFYTLTDDAAFVNVIGVLHARMDMHGHLP